MTPRRWVFVSTGVIAILIFAAGLLSFRHRTPSVSGDLETKTVTSTNPLLNQADAARHAGSLLEAKEIYLRILQQSPSTSMAAAVQERLGEVSLRLILSPTMTPDATTYVVQPGDTLSKISRKFHMTLELLMAANGLTDDRIRPGQRLKVVQANFSVVVDKSQNTLTLKQGEEVLKVYRCSTGQGGMTPIGVFKITNRIPDPPWFTPNGVVPSGDPRNILGSRWMGFDLPSYGIHGTTDPASIGKPVTQGCVRLNNADVEELYTLLPIGTQVTIVE